MLGSVDILFFSNFLIKKCGKYFLKNTFTPLTRIFPNTFLENNKILNIQQKKDKIKLDRPHIFLIHEAMIWNTILYIFHQSHVGNQNSCRML